jgi:hypothetical protein
MGLMWLSVGYIVGISLLILKRFMSASRSTGGDGRDWPSAR